MKKKFNSLLLVLAVCGGSAYGAEWEDDRTMKNVMAETLLNLYTPAKRIKEANEALNALADWKKALSSLSELLTDHKVIDGKSPKEPYEIKRMAKDMIESVVQKIKEKKTGVSQSVSTSDSNTMPTTVIRE